MRCSIPMRICGAIVVLAILGIAGVAEADITIYVKNGSTAAPVKVKAYDLTYRVVIAWLPSGVRKVMPKSTICAIVDDGRESRVHILNKCAFTPDEFAKIQKVKEKIRKRSEALKQLREEQRKAANAKWAAKALRRNRARREAEDAKSRLRAYTSLWIQVHSSSEKELVWTHPPGDYFFGSVAACRRRGEALMAKGVVYFAPRTYPVYDVNCLPGGDIPRPFVLNEDLGWK